MTKRRKTRNKKATRKTAMAGRRLMVLSVTLSTGAALIAGFLVWLSWPEPMPVSPGPEDTLSRPFQWEEHLPAHETDTAPNMKAVSSASDPIAALIEEVAPAPADTPAGQAGDLPPADVLLDQAPGPDLVLPPIPASPDDPAWKIFAARSPSTRGRPQVAIIIDDLGLNDDRTRDAIDLPAPLTLALLPYAYHLQTYADLARRAGHELLVHMPMEPLGVDADPGPDALLVDIPEAEFKRRLSANLAEFKGYVGINNHMGSRLTMDTQAMAVIMAELKQRGLLFLDSRTTGRSVAGEMAAQYGVPHISRDVFLDNSPEPAHIRAQLALVRDLARRQGHVVVISHPYDTTLAELRRWLPLNNDLAFVPLSQLVAEREKLRADLR